MRTFLASGRPAGTARRLATMAAALTIAAAGLVATPGSAAAVRTVPWRFTFVQQSAFVDYMVVKGFTLQCPAGYTAVSGGTAAGDIDQFVRLLEYPNPADGTYHVTVQNRWSGTTVTVTATCVWLDDVGTVTTVWGEFARNGSGRAGGNTVCPEGTTILSAGVDWSDTSVDRRIDYSSPADGNGRTWYVAGSSPTSGSKLYVELRCVADSLLAGEYAEADDSVLNTQNWTIGTAVAACASGYRMLTGGTAPAGARNPGADQGRAYMSGPMDYFRWQSKAWQPAGITIRAMAYCVPASTVGVSFTQTPAALSNLSTGTITFQATDVAGETFGDRCYLDGAERSCASGNPMPYGPLLDGSHTVRVAVANQSGYAHDYYFSWVIDATVPVISDHSPSTSAALTGPTSITFSEAVTGVNATSLVVHAEAANVDVAGTVATPTTSTATWTPKSRLTPGETYRFTFSNSIHDLAGNPLTTTFFLRRTATTVDSAASALEQYWDRDGLSTASGGAYIVSRQAGSRADLTFTAKAGDTLSVYGIRRSNGGYADIYLDGVKKATASFYAASTGRARVYLSAALTAGSHTLSIRPLNTKPAASSATWVAVDNVTYGSTFKEETSFKQVFRAVASTSAYSGSYALTDGANATDTTPAKFQLTLVGTGVKVYATKTSTSGQARIYIDGVLKTTVNLNAATTAYQALVYSGTFGLGVHTIRIEAVGTSSGSSSYINVDRITIT